MSNFIGLVYATLKNEGIDTSKMSTDEAIKKYNELQKKSGGKAGEKEATPAENRKLNKNKYRTEETENYKPTEFKKTVNEYKPKNELEKKNIEKYLKDIESEPKISQDMAEIAEKHGTELYGWDFRVKSANSFLRKIQKDDDKEIKDNVRYTFRMDKNPVEFYNNVVRDLEKKGYKEIIVKNYWMNKTNPYNGINTNFESPDGRIIEVQYHTPESIDVKENKSHKIYELQRQYEQGSPEFIEYEKQMNKLWEQLTPPKGIEKIKNKGVN